MRNGDIGADVSALQKRIGIDVDGVYGPATVAAVREFQQQHGLVADGIAGEKTLAALRDGMPDPRHLTHADIADAAALLEVPISCVMAVNEVESIGHGYLDDGRTKILFERHVMYQRLKLAGHDADALAAQYPNIINPQRGGYAGGAAEHARLKTAIGIDRTCALESASWGLFQIMGYHWQALDYDSADDFVACMDAGEAEQLISFVRFIKADPALHVALQNRKWAEFARRYNGPAYKDNLYDVKLARAYERHQQTGSEE